MADYALTRRASSDLLSIWNHVAEDNFDAADRLRDEFRAAFQRLAEMPYLGHTWEEVIDISHRFWRVRSYFIVYRPETKPLQIIRIVHAARDLKALFAG